MLNENMIEDLLNLFRNLPNPINLNTISKSLKIPSDVPAYEELKKILRDLCDQGILERHSRRKYSLADLNTSSEIEGIVEINKGRGIVITNIPDYPKIIIRRHDLLTALHGDKVRVKLHAIRKGRKPRGEVTEVLERNKELFVGTIEFDETFYFIIPDDDKYYVDFLVSSKELKGAQSGDKVEAQFLHWDDPNKSPRAIVSSILGKAGNLSVQYEGLIKDLSLPGEFDKSIEKEVNKLSLNIGKNVIDSRLDIRDLNIITIDPEDARDFDDALSIEELPNGNWWLGVHIADVSHYVPENSRTDIEARFRGTSIYLVDRVIPMLPEKLSNIICSLNPNEDRLAFTVFMEVTKRGAVKKYEIEETVIRSKRRFNYDEVLEIIDGREDEYSEMIATLHKLAEILKKKRFQKGGIEFETVEVRYKLDEHKIPVEAFLKKSTPSTSLVEECMLLANKVVAEHLTVIAKQKRVKDMPFLYRVHEEPDQKQLKTALQFISTFGPKITKSKISSKDINSVFNQIKNEDEKFIIHNILIRSMAKAIYTPNNVGHYGLGFDKYTHFTSPIRRYPDLVVHRVLKEYQNGKIDPSRLDYLRVFMKDAGKHSSIRERVAIEAERESQKLTGCALAVKHIGDVVNGVISGVTGFGIFVNLEGIHIEGMLHIRDLVDDYYYYDEKRYCLIGRKSKNVYRIGKKMMVRISDVNIDKRKIGLVLYESE